MLIFIYPVLAKNVHGELYHHHPSPYLPYQKFLKMLNSISCSLKTNNLHRKATSTVGRDPSLYPKPFENEDGMPTNVGIHKSQEHVKFRVNWPIYTTPY